jgi:hypothetical protein
MRPSAKASSVPEVGVRMLLARSSIREPGFAQAVSTGIACPTRIISQSYRGAPMESLEQLTGHYGSLRKELDAAYAADPWDSRQINRIADEMAPLEVAIARCSPGKEASDVCQS